MSRTEKLLRRIRKLRSSISDASRLLPDLELKEVIRMFNEGDENALRKVRKAITEFEPAFEKFLEEIEKVLKKGA